VRRVRADRLLAAWFLVGLPLSLGAQQRDEQMYYPGSFNWSFLKRYPEAGRLFNGFDFGHAILYEDLWQRPTAPVETLEQQRFDYLTRDLLRRPPRFAIAEESVAPQYARLAWRAVLVFERAHELHRQIYDVYAAEHLSDSARIELVERLTDWYLRDRRYALAAVPKDMALMDEQPYSQIFRQQYPKFNGLIWAYHWLQVGLYEPLLQGSTPADAKEGVRLALNRFWEMVEQAPANLPAVMPMTSAVAPTFAKRHLRAAVIFDNLHMLHDIISDILLSDRVARDDKGAAIDAALDVFQHPTKDVIEMEHWWSMADHMGGVERMGGRVPGVGRKP
jgi:hypothetical protein